MSIKDEVLTIDEIQQQTMKDFQTLKEAAKSRMANGLPVSDELKSAIVTVKRRLDEQQVYIQKNKDAEVSRLIGIYAGRL